MKETNFSPDVKTEFFAHLKAICIPRLAGGEGEARVGKYICETLRRVGLKVEEQEFEFSLLPLKIAKIWLLGELTLLFILQTCWIYYPEIVWVFGLFLILAGAISFYFPGFLFKSASKFVGAEKYKSKNIMASLPDFSTNSPPNSENPAGGEINRRIYFIAHYDSKSETIPLGLRTILHAFSAWGCLCWGVLGVCVSFENPVIPHGVLFSFNSIYLLTMASLILLLLSKMSDRSPGATDNGAAVAVLLELAGYFAENPPKKVQISLLATGAEELGLAGIRAFLRYFRSRWSFSDELYFINFEAIGAKKHWVTISQRKPRLDKLVRQAGRDISLKFGCGFFVPGCLMDHMPLEALGYEAVTISALSRKSWWIHSAKDKIELIDPEALDKALELGKRIVEILEEK